MNDINIIKWKIEKSNFNMETKIIFKPDEDGINNIINTIKNFGEIYLDNYKKYAFRNCPLNAKEEIKYTISGNKNNIFTKTGKSAWMGTICINELDKSIEEHIWKIKILKTTQFKNIKVGAAPIDFDINSTDHDNKCGWYYYCYNSQLRSGPPFNYYKDSGLSKINDEIIIIMNMKKRALKFKINNEDKGDSYINIPIDKPIFPAVLLYDQNDSIEII